MCKQMTITINDTEKTKAMKKAASADKKIDGMVRYYNAKLRTYRIIAIMLTIFLIAATAWGHYRDEDAKAAALTAANAIISQRNAEDAVAAKNVDLETYHTAMIAAYGYDPVNPEEGDIPSGDHAGLDGGGEVK